MSSVVPLLIFLVSMTAMISGIVWFCVFSIRRHHAEQARLQLSNRYFAGSPEVAIRPSDWRIDEDSIRQLAQQRGYHLLPQPDPNLAVFRLAPPTAAHGSPAPRTVAPPTNKQLRRRQALAAKLASGNPVWVPSCELGATPADIDLVARQHGFVVARAFGDRTRPMLLLARAPVRNIVDTLPPGTRTPLASLTRHVVMIAMVLFALFSGVAALGAITRFELTGALAAAMLVVPLLVFVLAAALPFSIAFRDSSIRMAALIREFDGSPKVRILTQHYLLDRLVVGDVAAELGYSYLNSMNSWLGSSRFNQSWMTYIRNPNHDPRGHR